MESIISRSIFSPATGFIQRGGFHFTCNPYVGCTFGCVYCYAMYLPQNRRPKSDWGKWVQSKSNAVELAQKQAHKIALKPLYISSVTDPYQPIERSLELTRGILQQLIPHQPRVLIQTRGPLIIRDIDLLVQFHHLKVNYSVPTDSEEVFRQLEPKAPTLEKRWEAIRLLRQAKIQVGVCVTPTLPIQNPERFAEQILGIDPEVVVVQEFHDSQGAFGASTPETARKSLQILSDTHSGQKALVKLLEGKCNLREGEDGFYPP
ncbi:MAG: SPL family radical SAM protein [Gemmataceae bacterium]